MRAGGQATGYPWNRKQDVVECTMFDGGFKACVCRLG